MLQYEPVSKLREMNKISKAVVIFIAQGAYAGASAALERARTIRKAGHVAAIFHNKLDGFMVLDENDAQQRRRIGELRGRS